MMEIGRFWRVTLSHSPIVHILGDSRMDGQAVRGSISGDIRMRQVVNTVRGFVQHVRVLDVDVCNVAIITRKE